MTTAKYMATPWGTFELKCIFSVRPQHRDRRRGLQHRREGADRQFIAAEDAKKPLSDSAIAGMLDEQGIQCARRTVAKYREAMKIAPANLRKAL